MSSNRLINHKAISPKKHRLNDVRRLQLDYWKSFLLLVLLRRTARDHRAIFSLDWHRRNYVLISGCLVSLALKLFIDSSGICLGLKAACNAVRWSAKLKLPFRSVEIIKNNKYRIIFCLGLSRSSWERMQWIMKSSQWRMSLLKLFEYPQHSAICITLCIWYFLVNWVLLDKNVKYRTWNHE